VLGPQASSPATVDQAVLVKSI